MRRELNDRRGIASRSTASGPRSPLRGTGAGGGADRGGPGAVPRTGAQARHRRRARHPRRWSPRIGVTQTRRAARSRSVSRCPRVGNLDGVALCLEGLAETAHAACRPARAAHLSGRPRPLREATGAAADPRRARPRRPWRRCRCGRPWATPTVAAAWAVGAPLPLGGSRRLGARPTREPVAPPAAGSGAVGAIGRRTDAARARGAAAAGRRPLRPRDRRAPGHQPAHRRPTTSPPSSPSSASPPAPPPPPSPSATGCSEFGLQPPSVLSAVGRERTARQRAGLDHAAIALACERYS